VPPTDKGRGLKMSTEQQNVHQGTVLPGTQNWRTADAGIELYVHPSSPAARHDEAIGDIAAMEAKRLDRLFRFSGFAAEIVARDPYMAYYARKIEAHLFKVSERIVDGYAWRLYT
jgi:hypothetical protein